MWHSFWQRYSDIPSGILFGTVSDIYIYTYSGIIDILSGILSDVYSDILSDILCGILSDI